jgi:hypothetical protein
VVEEKLDGSTKGDQDPDAPDGGPSTNEPAAPVPAGLGQWKYLPVPEGEPEPHAESASLCGLSPEGMRIIAARVRGVKHKHEGLNCDDWFEFANAGPWTIIAVSDGAGSARFSRVGAEHACKAAVRQICHDLKDHQIETRTNWSPETWQRDEATGSFAEEDLEKVQVALHAAMLAAYDAVEQAAHERSDRPEYEACLSRKPNIDDFAATLLLAIHCTVKVREAEYSLIMTCQVGDGMMAAVNGEGGFQLLAQPDKGSYGGETVFITDKKKLGRTQLMRKTFPYFSPMRALMVMTDGVADIYFPPDPEMLRLYGDLVLNGVIELRGPGPEKITGALEKTRLRTPEAVKNAPFDEPMMALTAKGQQKVRLLSVTAYAAALELSIPEVTASPSLLAAGVRRLEGATDSADRLRLWLDSYMVRGERDDRTLIVLHREEAT